MRIPLLLALMVLVCWIAPLHVAAGTVTGTLPALARLAAPAFVQVGSSVARLLATFVGNVPAATHVASCECPYGRVSLAQGACAVRLPAVNAVSEGFYLPYVAPADVPPTDEQCTCAFAGFEAGSSTGLASFPVGNPG